MNKEIQFLVTQFQESLNGDPWFGRNAQKLLGEVTEAIAFQNPNGQHSIAELVWHMVNWREFVISRFRKDANKDLHYFETNDWRQLDHSDSSLWRQGLNKLYDTQEVLLHILQDQSDSILDRNVEERTYNYRKLLHGVIQHDIYHLGQIAYLVKYIKEEE
jgi:uncharacterized damage-inducible protein DinB